MALPQAILPIADDEDQYARILLYGDSGVGKSTLAAESPNCIMLFNDPDEGRFAKTQGTSAHRWVVRDYDDLTEAVEFLKLGDHEFEWVWLDNGSIFQDQGMQQVMDELVAAKPHRSPFIPDKAEYMLNQQRFSFLIREMKALPMNVGIIANSMYADDEDGESSLMPLFQGGRGAFSNKICGLMGVVAYMEVAKAKKGDEIIQVRKITTGKTDRIYAKDRYGKIGDTMQEPSMEKILAKIGGGKPRAKRPPARRPVGKKVAGKVSKGAAKRRPAKKSAVTRRAASTK